MAEEEHGFSTREEWSKWFTEYNAVISNLNESSYELVMNDLPAAEWIDRYRDNAAQVRGAYRRNEAELNRHIRWFTRAPGRWTRAVADPLLDTLFRYVTRIQDLGTAHEISESLSAFYGAPGDEIARMKCCTVRAFSCGFLDPIHLSGEVDRDCARAMELYERHFASLTPEERSMGLSIYDLGFDHAVNLIKLGHITPGLLGHMTDLHAAASRALEAVVAEDRNYEFNSVLPEFDYYLAFAALRLSPGGCTREQAEAIFRAAERQQRSCETDPEVSDSKRLESCLTYRMARRLVGRCTDGEALGTVRDCMERFVQPSFASGTFSQHTVNAVEAILLAAETLTRHGKIETELYGKVQELFIQHFATLPYTVLADYVCASHNYCYILSVLPNRSGDDSLIWALMKLTMFRQVQTFMHSIMVAKLAVELLDSMLRSRPELLVGQLGASDVEEVKAQSEDFRRHLYCGGLLHDVGKLLCSSVINAQSHKLGELEFRVLKYHPVTGGEMLEHIPGLSVFRDIALGHHKSYDGAFGYPPEFDNTASPQRICIDIITVCDSLDAATDHLGRSYTTAKDFSTVLDELRAGRGTRYSGDVVDLLDGDAVLQSRVRRLLDEGRRAVYYGVHELIISESRNYPDPRRTHEWHYDLGLPSTSD